MELGFYKKPISALVRDWPRLREETEKCRCLFITISPAPHVKFANKALKAIDYLASVNKTSKKLVKSSQIVKRVATYGTLPQKCQFRYCMDVFKKLYLQFCDPECEYVGTWELNQKGNVHLHVLMYSKLVQTDTDLALMRRDIYNHDIAFKSHKGKRDVMNHIVFATDPRQDIIDYMDKCYDQNTGNGINFNYAPSAQVGVEQDTEKPPSDDIKFDLDTKIMKVKGSYLDEINFKFF